MRFHLDNFYYEQWQAHACRPGDSPMSLWAGSDAEVGAVSDGMRARPKTCSRIAGKYAAELPPRSIDAGKTGFRRV